MQVLAMGSNYGPANEFGYTSARSKINIYPAFGEGLRYWTAHRLTGNSEVYKYFSYAYRRTNDSKNCGSAGVPTTQTPSDKGVNLDNVTMYNEVKTSTSGVFPFSVPNGFPIGGGDLAGVYFGALFYSLAYEYGMGLENVDRLVWKTLSLISETGTFTNGTIETRLTMRQLAAKSRQAARELFPRSATGLSLYEDHIFHAFTSRGIPLKGVAGLANNLPPALGLPYTNGSAPGTLELDTPGTVFGTSDPEPHPDSSSYGGRSYFADGYNPITEGNDYMA